MMENELQTASKLFRDLKGSQEIICQQQSVTTCVFQFCDNFFTSYDVNSWKCPFIFLC